MSKCALASEGLRCYSANPTISLRGTFTGSDGVSSRIDLSGTGGGQSVRDSNPVDNSRVNFGGRN